MNPRSGIAVAAMVGSIVVTATAGDVAIASAMRKIDLTDLRKTRGIGAAILAVVRSGRFLFGLCAMAASFFALLYSLSHADVSLIAPAAGSLTFVSNAIAAKWFLGENVDRRRWFAAIVICCGVALLRV